MPDTFISGLRQFLREVLPVVDEVDKLLTRNKIFIDRTQGVGSISKEDAIAYGITGPNLRACGVDEDLRVSHPYLGYEKYEFDVPVGSHGDCYDRYLVRMEELRQSVRILNQVLDRLPPGPINVGDPKGRLPEKEGVLMKMEELIHHFIVATQGIDAPGWRGLFWCGESEGRTGFLHQQQGRRRASPA